MNYMETNPYPGYRQWVPINGLILLVCNICGCAVPSHEHEQHTGWHEEDEAR